MKANINKSGPKEVSFSKEVGVYLSGQEEGSGDVQGTDGS